MLLLLDQVNDKGKMLKDSLRAAGYEIPEVSVLYDGYLPDGMVSPYGVYSGTGNESGRPRYFNQIQIPPYWNIDANGGGAEIYDEDNLRGRIFYAEPKYKRLVRIIDWLDRGGRVRCSDHYDRYGRRFAQTVLNEKQNPIMKFYYAPNGMEKIMENFVTGNIVLEEDGRTRTFANKSSFVTYFLQDMNYNLDCVLYNSLSTPFFVSDRLGQKGIDGHDILFWQEISGDQTPGNMVQILEKQASRTDRVIVQNRNEYDTLRTRHPKTVMLDLLGFIYDFSKESKSAEDLTIGDNHQTGSSDRNEVYSKPKEKDRKHALILTNSDRVEGLELIAQRLPQLQITVAAITEMSGKLLAMSRYSNIKLLPNIRASKVDSLIESASIYLDINHEGEILDGVRRALNSDLLIMGWDQTKHHDDMIAKANIFEAERPDEMIDALSKVMEDKSVFETRLSWQHTYAMAETKESYRAMLKSV